MTSPRAEPSPPPSFLAWLVVLSLLLGFVAWDAIVGSKRVLETSSTYGVTVDAPAIDPRSPTGYADGRRSSVLPAGGMDTAHWIMQTQSMLAQGEWRVRHVDYDNAPRGRDVHWAMPFHAWLAVLAWIDHTISGTPMGIAVERATLSSGPVMLGLLLIGLIPFLSRHFSNAAAALIGVGTIAVLPFYLDFMPARADHHGLANICALLTMLGLLMGGSTASRRWIIASAVAGGVGLWISAATLAPVLVAAGCGALAAAWIDRTPTSGFADGNWPVFLRLWGWVGGATSFGAYLIEYFPGEMSLRLEVNHPLYALAWTGAGEVVAAAALAFQKNGPGLAPRDRRRALIGGIAAALLPTVILLTKARTFVVADPFVWKLHALYISEFQGLPGNLARKGLSRSGLELLLPMLLLLPPLWLALRSDLPRETKAKIVLVGIPALLGWLMGWNQIRWLSLAYALSVPAVALFFQTLKAYPRGKLWSVTTWTAACGALLIPGAIGALQRIHESDEVAESEVRSLAERDVAHWLRLRGGAERVVVAGAPTSTTKLISFGGLNGVGTLYWENAEGLKNAAALFGAISPEAAHEIVRRLGVTHIVLFSWDAFEVMLAKLSRGLPESAPIPDDLFVANLLKSPVPPPWLRAIPFKLPNHPSLTGAQVRIWEVTPDQSPPEMIAHAANYYLELGMPEIAAQFAPRLREAPNNLSAMTMLAGLASRQRDGATFAAAMQRATALLARADELALDDQVHLVVVLAVADQTELARACLRNCLNRIDERQLRHLTPGTLSDLLALCDAFGAEFPSPGLKRLAERLVPPSKRK